MIPVQINDVADPHYPIDLLNTERAVVNVAKEIVDNCDPTNVIIGDSEIRISYGPEVDVCYEFSNSSAPNGGFYISYKGNIVNGHWF